MACFLVTSIPVLSFSCVSGFCEYIIFESISEFPVMSAPCPGQLLEILQVILHNGQVISVVLDYDVSNLVI